MQQELEKAKERALRFQKMLKSEKMKQMALEVCFTNPNDMIESLNLLILTLAFILNVH